MAGGCQRWLNMCSVSSVSCHNNMLGWSLVLIQQREHRRGGGGGGGVLLTTKSQQKWAPAE